MDPDGFAARSDREPLTYFEPGVAYEHAVQVAGGYGERVENAADLPAAMERAVDAAVTRRWGGAAKDLRVEREDDGFSLRELSP